MDRPATDSPAPIAVGRNPFRAPQFFRWWLGCMAAGTGIGIQTVAVPLFVRDRVDDDVRAAAIAGVLVAQTLPGALLVLFAGALADRTQPRQILWRAYTLSALASCGYVALILFDVPPLWPVFVLAAIVGGVGGFTNPARQAILPQIVQRSQIQNAVILGTMGFMATVQFLGPTIAGFVVELAGLAQAFAVEVLLLATGAVLFAGVYTPTPSASGRSILHDLADGLRYVRGEPALIGLLLLGPVVGVFFIGPFSVTLPILIPDVFQETDRWVGIFWGCFGAGVFIGSVTLTFWPIPRRGFAVCWSTFQGGVVLMLYAFSTSLPLTCGLLVLWGLGASLFMNYVATLLQEHTETSMLGRVMSMYSLSFFASQPLGYAQAGFVSEAIGPQWMLFSSGVAAAAIGLGCLLFLGPVRRLA